MIKKAILNGFFAAFFLLWIYFGITTFISGFDFAKNQFFQFWYYILGLALGFGIQFGLYNYLKVLIKDLPAGRQGKKFGKKAVVSSGATSTFAMVSCCSHYLVNFAPFLGASAFLSVIGQYQIQFFWLGLLANLAGIIYLLRKVDRNLKADKLD